MFHVCVKISSFLQQCKKYENRSRFLEVMIINVQPPFSHHSVDVCVHKSICFVHICTWLSY